MELPRLLRARIDDALHAVPAAALRRASDTLSRRYRAEVRDGHAHLRDDLFAQGYLAARMPATYAALRIALAMAADARPDLAPRTLLDVGAGPGTALWAAADAFASLAGATLLEASDPIRRAGERLAEGGFAFRPDWRAGDLRRDLAPLPAADLVTLGYVLDEIDPAAADPLADALWARTGALFLVVEPGTPAGWRRVLAVRDRLVGQGAHVAAPCPHEASCPVAAPDWCHFARRVARSRVHLAAKEAEVPWEDEKFAFVALAREPAPARPAARVLAPPRAGSGKVQLKLCRADGTLAHELVTRRAGERFARARRLDWGDGI